MDKSTRMSHRHLLMHIASGCAPWPVSSSSLLRRLSTQQLPAGVALGAVLYANERVWRAMRAGAPGSVESPV